jgi:hypothetical protein
LNIRCDGGTHLSMRWRKASVERRI